MSWRDFWNGRTTIYANARHQQVHYRLIAQEIVGLIAAPEDRVLDFGCGEAHSAELVAKACGALVLCDAADSVRERVTLRTRDLDNVAVVAPDELYGLSDGSFDVIVVNSVVQYFSRPELESWLAEWRRLLSPRGRLVLGDIVPRSVGPVADAMALLKFARANGFLIAAGGSLVRTAFSDYRRKRAKLGLLQLEEQEIADIVVRSGFDLSRKRRNLGHNPLRLTVVATPTVPAWVHAANARARQSNTHPRRAATA